MERALHNLSLQPTPVAYIGAWRASVPEQDSLMNVLDFEKIVKSEKVAMHYVLTRCSMTGPFRCPSCSSEKLYEIESGKRRRCARCGHTFNPFAGRYLNNVKLTAHEWLWLVKLFELEMSATVITGETGISYPTVLKSIDTIRCALADERGADGAVTGGREAGRHLAISNGPGSHDEPYDADSGPESGIFFHLAFGDDCLVLTKRSSNGQFLRCGDRRLEIVDYGKNFPRLKVYCSAKGFWPFAKERLMKYHGVPLNKLPRYLEEMSFRWMNRGTPLFDLILEKLCRYAPEEGIRRGRDAARRESVPESVSLQNS